MRVFVTRPIIASAALCCAAFALWCWPRGADDAPPIASPAERMPDDSAPAHAGRPAAMRDAATYAAVRLREIKAAPESWRDVWKWRAEFSAAGTPELRREVVALARQIGPGAFLAVLPQALASDDAWLRLDAARSIALLPEARLRDGVAIGVDAADADTRNEVMDVVAQAPVALRASLLEKSLAAGPDVVARSLELFRAQPAPELFAVLIDGLRSEESATRTAIGDAMSAIVAQRFEDHESAARWWAANRESFDDEMLRSR